MFQKDVKQTNFLEALSKLKLSFPWPLRADAEVPLLNKINTGRIESLTTHSIKFMPAK